MNGSTATRIICERYPRVKVLALSTYDDSQYISEAIHAGASGYLLKDMPCDELAEAIRFAYRGYSQLAPGMLHKIIPHTTKSEEAVCQELALPALTRLEELTSRELEVMRFVGTGATNREIAQKLFISEGTVKAHLTRIFSCLNLKNRSQLAIYANKLVREFDRK
jgi:DNA-binding NarL/FixJ family response regulator